MYDVYGTFTRAGSLTPSMVTLPLASMVIVIVSPTALEVVIVMTPSARSELVANSVPRRAKSQMRSCLFIVLLI